ncbi:MAG: hypothetical protein K2X66_16915, partial [Cyanobacteria bacterium]|nr:hypothetical protein [Cyanobacteriota bacterium]
CWAFWEIGLIAPSLPKWGWSIRGRWEGLISENSQWVPLLLASGSFRREEMTNLKRGDKKQPPGLWEPAVVESVKVFCAASTPAVWDDEDNNANNNDAAVEIHFLKYISI